MYSSCPVCGQNLARLGRPEAQEAHVRTCLEGPKDTSALQQPVKYIVYRLPAESALVGVECVICRFANSAIELLMQLP